MSAGASEMGIEVPVTFRSRQELPDEVAAPEFPDEVAEVAELRAELDAFDGNSLEWGLSKGVMKIGQVSCAEVSPTYRCPESCPGCPDANLVLVEDIKAGRKPAKEDRVDSSTFAEHTAGLKALGVKHVMNIGGTIDKLHGLDDIIEAQLDAGLIVSWFTDGIAQIDEKTGETTPLFDEMLGGTWLKRVATHVSTDYVYGHGSEEPLDLFGDELTLPEKRGRNEEFKIDAEKSREFKSQYGPIMARRLVEAGARRVVLNMTIGHPNADQIDAMYEQAVAIRDYGEKIGSPTEVLFTFSPWVWRPHQARGDDPAKNPASGGLHAEDMPVVNASLTRILDDTYKRVEEGRPRVLANSSGYTYLHADKAFRHEAVQQDVPYRRGLPLMLQIEPNAELKLDPMFKGPELTAVRSTFGYMDREPDPTQNPFSDFQHGNRLYLPNLISSENVDDPDVQPKKMMDRRLARMIVQRGAMEYYTTKAKLMNKSDSPHSMGNPRVLGSDPYDIRYLADRMLHVARTECDPGENGMVLAGIASFGLGLAEVMSMASIESGTPVPSVYVKLADEDWKGKRQIEGTIDITRQPVEVDDLIFHSRTTRETNVILVNHGYSPVRDTIHIVDRQLQHLDNPDKPNLTTVGIKDHSLITMNDIVVYGVENGAIDPDTLDDLIVDYNLFPRLDMPKFADVELDESQQEKLRQLRITIAEQAKETQPTL